MASVVHWVRRLWPCRPCNRHPFAPAVLQFTCRQRADGADGLLQKQSKVVQCKREDARRMRAHVVCEIPVCWCCLGWAWLAKANVCVMRQCWWFPV